MLEREESLDSVEPIVVMDVDEMKRYGFDPAIQADVEAWQAIIASQQTSTEPYDYSEDTFAFGAPRQTE